MELRKLEHGVVWNERFGEILIGFSRSSSILEVVSSSSHFLVTVTSFVRLLECWRESIPTPSPSTSTDVLRILHFQLKLEHSLHLVSILCFPHRLLGLLGLESDECEFRSALRPWTVLTDLGEVGVECDGGIVSGKSEKRGEVSQSVVGRIIIHEERVQSIGQFGLCAIEN